MTKENKSQLFKAWVKSDPQNDETFLDQAKDLIDLLKVIEDNNKLTYHKAMNKVAQSINDDPTLKHIWKKDIENTILFAFDRRNIELSSIAVDCIKVAAANIVNNLSYVDKPIEDL